MSDNSTPCDAQEPDLVKVRLTLDVIYRLNGEDATEMASNLQRMCERAIGEGMLTGASDAEVDEYSMETNVVPPSEEELAQLKQRREQVNLLEEDIPWPVAD